jgi:hypothetical protein
MAGICAEKALRQNLCKRINNSDILHVFILIAKMTVQTQILRWRGFCAYVPVIILSKYNF